MGQKIIQKKTIELKQEEIFRIRKEEAEKEGKIYKDPETVAREESEKEEIRTREIKLEELKDKCDKNGWNYEEKKAEFIKSEEALKKEIEDLKRENNELKEENDIFGVKIEDLKTENEELKHKIEQAKKALNEENEEENDEENEELKHKIQYALFLAWRQR